MDDSQASIGEVASTVEAWCRAYIASTDLGHKTCPPALPDRDDARSWEPVDRAPERIERPGRPPQLQVVARAPRSVKRGQLVDPQRRAQLLHTFWHHELQAAELFAWAVLAFPDTPREFRSGLLDLLHDELRHMRMYAGRLTALGSEPGAFPVRDWFWQRVPQCRTARQFVALLGVGLEGGNLDHAERFAEWFAAAGDPQSAKVQDVVGREEIAHVRFAVRWLRHWQGSEGPLDFATWSGDLIAPLTPMMFRGPQVARARRRAAGLDDAFVDSLQHWSPEAT